MKLPPLVKGSLFGKGGEPLRFYWRARKGERDYGIFLRESDPKDRLILYSVARTEWLVRWRELSKTRSTEMNLDKWRALEEKMKDADKNIALWDQWWEENKA